MTKEELLYGIHPIREAVQSGKEIEKVIISKSVRGEHAEELKALVREHKIPSQYVPQDWFKRLHGRNHQGFACYLSAVEYQPIEQVVPMIWESGKTPFLLLLDRITDVRNFGAIARTAECAGVDAIIVPDRNSALLCADAVRTSAGALNIIPVCRVSSLKKTVEYLRESGIKIVGATEKGSELYTEVDYTTPVAIVMGSEEDGLSTSILETAEQLVSLPQIGTIPSLNVSVAAGIILYETIRQRNL